MPTVSAAVRAPIVPAMFAWRDEIAAMKCPARLVINLVHPNVVVHANAADIMESAAEIAAVPPAVVAKEEAEANAWSVVVPRMAHVVRDTAVELIRRIDFICGKVTARVVTEHADDHARCEG